MSVSADLNTQILVECNVIIITGSATVLRPLWHKPARSGYQNYDYDMSGGRTGGSRVTHHGYGTGTIKDSTKTVKTNTSNLGDGTSEEYILDSRPGDGRPKRDIICTTDYSVAFDKDTRVPEEPYLPDERIYPEHKQW